MLSGSGMSKETTPPASPARFTNRVRVFILMELFIGLLFISTGIALMIFSNQLAGLAVIVIGVWLQLSIMLWRTISYLIAILLEIAPALRQLNKILSGVNI